MEEPGRRERRVQILIKIVVTGVAGGLEGARRDGGVRLVANAWQGLTRTVGRMLDFPQGPGMEG
jgi:hypothetical protein